jgi:putative acetyltransferase
LDGRRNHAAHLGMGVHDDYAGRGIGTALLRALLDTADNWINLKRLELTVFVDNAPAVALYERHGFENEGTLRAYAFRNGAFVDAYAMARIRP